MVYGVSSTHVIVIIYYDRCTLTHPQKSDRILRGPHLVTFSFCCAFWFVFLDFFYQYIPVYYVLFNILRSENCFCVCCKSHVLINMMLLTKYYLIKNCCLIYCKVLVLSTSWTTVCLIYFDFT